MYKPSFSLLAFVFVLSPQHWSGTLQAGNVHFLNVLHTSNRDKVRICLEKGYSRVQETCYRWLLYNWRVPQANWSTKKSVATMAQLPYIWWMKLAANKKNEAGETLLSLKGDERKRLHALKTMRIRQDLIYSWNQPYFFHTWSALKDSTLLMHKEFIPSGSLYKIFTGLVSRTESMWSIYKGEMAFTKDVFNCLNKKASINEWATERFIMESAVLLRMLMGRVIQNKSPKRFFFLPDTSPIFPLLITKAKERLVLSWLDFLQLVEHLHTAS